MLKLTITLCPYCKTQRSDSNLNGLCRFCNTPLLSKEIELPELNNPEKEKAKSFLDSTGDSGSTL